jgi:hypothetical protein
MSRFSENNTLLNDPGANNERRGASYPRNATSGACSGFNNIYYKLMVSSPIVLPECISEMLSVIQPAAHTLETREKCLDLIRNAYVDFQRGEWIVQPRCKGIRIANELEGPYDDILLFTSFYQQYNFYNKVKLDDIPTERVFQGKNCRRCGNYAKPPDAFAGICARTAECITCSCRRDMR